MEKLKELFNDVNAILQEEMIKKEESLRRGERFNMFQVCGVDHYEVKHSAIIASFLDPKGNHGQKDKFLKAFISIVDDKTGMETSSCSVYTEYVTNEGRIDILIEDNSGKCIIIENKMYAGDQNEQLKRYDKFSKEKYGEGNYTIYYLTLDEHFASDDSGKGINYTRISYKDHILNWIEECIKESATTPLIRETLIQYWNHIKQLTNQDMDTMNKEALLKSMAENADAVISMYLVQEDFKKYIFDHFVFDSPILQKLCEEKKLKKAQYNMFTGKRDKGFYFYKETWTSASIMFHTDNSFERDFYWGVSSHPNKLTVKQHKLNCLKEDPTEFWPYGWESLSMNRDWYWNAYLEMANGNFVKYIKDLILIALDEIEKNNIEMP